VDEHHARQGRVEGTPAGVGVGLPSRYVQFHCETSWHTEDTEEHRGEPGNGSVRDTLDSIFEVKHVEVEQETSLQAGETKIREQLCGVHGCQLVNRLDLHHHQVRDQEINPIAGVQLYRVICNRDRYLTLNLMSALDQLVRKADFISALQQTRAQCGMDGHGARKNALGKWVAMSGVVKHRLPL
jgi:hypothetical protein